ncbi:HPF/RaiA family ribosome-associated protein [Algoriphagus sp. AGSA1]|uniref:HPF/RaiA family ribosome-associated protein n=1 Tax=Algoriphagus sp. AGSA1 TaxID=2907213 RepID=UPI001F17B46B|nr:HPF/RaiA family ribosome-associated protein [Algoriphagus sp. AGSA1]MCE7058030.1 HPF/RaiA family ribosome-associated protein [Algoriphagus sp. AGSA1]
MNYTENYRGIKVDVQAPHVDVDETVQIELRSCIDKLVRFAHNINEVNLYINIEGNGGAAISKLGMRVAIPGPDIYADENGDKWVGMLKSVTDKNIRQLQKLK